MKRFRFTQHRVLRVRRQQLHLAEVQVRAASSRRSAAASLVGAAESRLHAHSRKMATVEKADLVLQHHGVRALCEQITEAKVRLQRAEEALAKQQVALRAVKTQVEALDTLRQRQQKVHRQREQRRDQSEIEQLVLARWARRQRKGRPAL